MLSARGQTVGEIRRRIGLSAHHGLAESRRLASESEACRRMMTVSGIGDPSASAFVTAIGREEQFRCGRDLVRCWGLSQDNIRAPIRSACWEYRKGATAISGASHPWRSRTITKIA